MAGRGAPTYLKRQKEQKRAARALAKRAAQQARRDQRAARRLAGETGEDEFELLSSPEEQPETMDDPPAGTD